MQQEAGVAADALAEARRELDAARAQIAELEQVSLERVGADVAHDTLVSLQQENEAAVAALAAASHELESANVQLAELDELRAERARAGERMQTLEARTQELQDELASRAARIDELESRLAEHASTAEQAEPEPPSGPTTTATTFCSCRPRRGTRRSSVQGLHRSRATPSCCRSAATRFPAAAHRRSRKTRAVART